MRGKSAWSSRAGDVGVAPRDAAAALAGPLRHRPQRGDLADVAATEPFEIAVPVHSRPGHGPFRAVTSRARTPSRRLLEGFRAVVADHHAVAMHPLARTARPCETPARAGPREPGTARRACCGRCGMRSRAARSSTSKSSMVRTRGSESMNPARSATACSGWPASRRSRSASAFCAPTLRTRAGAGRRRVGSTRGAAHLSTSSAPTMAIVDPAMKRQSPTARAASSIE